MAHVTRIENRPALLNGHQMFVTVVVNDDNSAHVVTGSEQETRTKSMDYARRVAHMLGKPLANSAETLFL